MHVKTFGRVACIGAIVFGVIQSNLAGAGLLLNEFLAVNNVGLQDENGERQDWIELFNSGTQAINLVGWHLTDDADDLNAWTFPSTNCPAGSYLLVFASGKNRSQTGQPLHTNFKLSGDGEYLGLVRPDGITVEDAYSPEFPAQTADVSFGRTTNLLDGVGYFSIPTPRATNSLAALAKVLDTKFSVDRGFFTNAIVVAISSATVGAQIRYTLDGSVPTAASTLYVAPLAITHTAVLRAVAFKSGYLSTDVDTQTYLFLDDVVQQPASPAGYPATWHAYTADYAMEDNTNDLKLIAGGTNANLSVQQARDLVKQSLAGLPVVSLVMSIADWFDYNTGIYANSQSQGPTWERACSVEYLPLGGEEGFQENAGVQMHGGTARFPEITPKHNIQVSFKNQFGESSLQYSLFTNAPVEEFNTLVLHADCRDCWTSPGDYGGVPNPRSQASYIRDAWVIESQRDMGVPTPGRRFVNLYINGMYWGVYAMTERADNYFAASRLGGESTAYDTVKNVFPAVAIEGDTTKWLQLKALANAGLASNASYEFIQGNKADGMRDPTNEILCDIESMLGFNLPGQYAAPYDWPGNWYADRLRGANSIGFHFFNWDADLSFVVSGLNDDKVTIGGGSIWDDTCGAVDRGCRFNAEYRLRYADFVHRHFFHEGAFTAPAAAARWMRLAAEIRPAMIAEAARWGDYRRDVHQYQTGPYELMTPSQHWEPTVQTMAQAHVAARYPIVLQQYRALGLYPSAVAPEFVVNGIMAYGGTFPAGATLTMSASNAIYFTQDGSDPRQYGTSAAVGALYTGPIPLSYSVRIKARALSGTNWSALAEAIFAPTLPTSLRITELMFDPRSMGGQTNWTSDDFEYVEFENQGTSTIGLAGLRVNSGINFDFTVGAAKTLAPAQFVLAVANRAAFASRYPTVSSNLVAGEFTRSFGLPRPVLRDEGEAFRLIDAQGSNVVAFTYRDDRGWPLAAAGAGHSLVPVAGVDQTHDLAYGGHWRASTFRDGSPGVADPEVNSSLSLNEFVAHTDYTNGQPWQDSNDWIELYNRGTTAVAFANWYLSDRADNLKLWALPASNVLLATAWRVFDEVTGFHTATNIGFGLNKAGDEIYLSCLPGNATDRVVDAIRFKGQENGFSEGRWRDGNGLWRTMLGPTPGAQNQTPASRVVLSEFMPHPQDLEGGGNNLQDEFVELYNPLAVTVALANVTGAWRLDGEVSYVFSNGAVLAPGQRQVIVGFDPQAETNTLQAFRDRYDLGAGPVAILGPWDGQLDNAGGRLALERPQAGDWPGDPINWVIVDEAIYFDRDPWTPLADGTGRSLQRIDMEDSGNDPVNWFAPLVATPGAPSVPLTLLEPEPGAVCFVGQGMHVFALTDGDRLQAPIGDVVFYEGTNVIAVDGAAPYEGAFVAPSVGIFSLHAEITDATGVITSSTVVVTVLGVNPVTILQTNDFVADVAGTISGDAAAVVVSVFWGEIDGGTNAESWSESTDAVVVGNTNFQAQLALTKPGTIYHARARGSHGGRVGWSPASTAFTSLSLGSWPWRMPITITGYTGTERLRNFPVLVALGSHVTGFAYDQLGTYWGSLRFQDGTGLALAFDMESWNTGGVSHVWVVVPELTNGVTITAYWGGGITGAPSYALSGAAWNTQYEAVWHMGESLADATQHGHDAVNMGSTTATGLVGTARSFDGGNDAIQPQLDAAWLGQAIQGLTISVWANPMAVSNMATFAAGSSPAALRMATRNDRARSWLYDVAYTSQIPYSYTTGQWHMISLVLSNGVAYGAKNEGPLVSLNAYAPFVPNGAPKIGANSGGGDWFRGQLDEVRVSARARSSDWLKAEYATVATPQAFAVYGAITAQGNPDEDGDGLPDAWERASFGSTNAPQSEAWEDWDLDGSVNQDEFIAGTDPTNPTSVFILSPGLSNGQYLISFESRTAEGDGYVGVDRYYNLLTASNLAGNPGAIWVPIAGMTNLPGSNSTHEYLTNSTLPRFYSGRVWLQ